MEKRKNTAFAAKIGLLGALILLGLVNLTTGVAQADESSVEIRAEVCSVEAAEPIISVTPLAGAVVLTSPATLNFQTSYVHKLVTKRGAEVLATSTPVYGVNQTFTQSVPLNEGANNLTFEIEGGCPRHPVVQNYNLEYNQNGTTLVPVITRLRSPALRGRVGRPDSVIHVIIEGNNYVATNNGDGTWTLPAGIIQPDLADGVYDVQIITYRPDNSVISDQDFSNHLRIDNINPQVTLTTVDTDKRSPTLTGTIDEPTSLIEVMINGNTYPAINNGDGTWILPAGIIQPELASGQYPVIIKARDLAGNETEITAELTVKAADELGFILSPNTGYLRIRNFNLPTWVIYLILIGIILGIIGRSRCLNEVK